MNLVEVKIEGRTTERHTTGKVGNNNLVVYTLRIYKLVQSIDNKSIVCQSHLLTIMTITSIQLCIIHTLYYGKSEEWSSAKISQWFIFINKKKIEPFILSRIQDKFQDPCHTNHDTIYTFRNDETNSTNILKMEENPANKSKINQLQRNLAYENISEPNYETIPAVSSQTANTAYSSQTEREVQVNTTDWIENFPHQHKMNLTK